MAKNLDIEKVQYIVYNEGNKSEPFLISFNDFIDIELKRD
jgi:hypothetical protein